MGAKLQNVCVRNLSGKIATLKVCYYICLEESVTTASYPFCILTTALAYLMNFPFTILNVIHKKYLFLHI